MTSYANASCPFPGGSKICLKEAGNIHIDTGIIDSHKHLGINARPTDRFGVQFNLKCAPLVTEGYKRRQKAGNNTSQDESTQYLYGGQIAHYGETNTSSHVTYAYPVRGQVETDFIVG